MPRKRMTGEPGEVVTLDGVVHRVYATPQFDHERHPVKHRAKCPIHDKVSTDIRGVVQKGVVFHCTPRHLPPEEGHTFVVAEDQLEGCDHET